MSWISECLALRLCNVIAIRLDNNFDYILVLSFLVSFRWILSLVLLLLYPFLYLLQYILLPLLSVSFSLYFNWRIFCCRFSSIHFFYSVCIANGVPSLLNLLTSGYECPSLSLCLWILFFFFIMTSIRCMYFSFSPFFLHLSSIGLIFSLYSRTFTYERL